MTSESSSVATAPSGNNDVLRSLIYSPADAANDKAAELQVLDQLLLPKEKVYVPVTNISAAWKVIHTMQIRGAPLIAIVAVLGLSVDLQSEDSAAELEQIETMNRIEHSAGAIYSYIQGKMDYIVTSRPTAVNLFNAMQELKQAVLLARDDTYNDIGTTVLTPRVRMVRAVAKHAEFMLQRDEADCRAIGRHGAKEILAEYYNDTDGDDDEKVTVMTICNTGSLATAAYGTALGVVRAIHAENRLKAVVSLETRPYNQGSRLTCFECLEDGLPGATLICDSMAAVYMAQNKVAACIVGADRVAANGDTANKIGTYALAVIAKAHGVPVYVASPFTTLDLSLKTGAEIPIEERPASELLSTSNAPEDMLVWNPAFDVTPASYISGIVTEKGVIHPDANGVIDVKAFVDRHNGTAVAAAVRKVQKRPSLLIIPVDYFEQDVASLPAYLATNVPKAMQVLEASTADELECVEMGDGNLNLVFIVSNKLKGGSARKVVVKQALPYVRCVGESWPLTLKRAFFEYAALETEKEACPEFVPDLYHFSKSNALIVMQYLAPPNIILRKGLIQGLKYNTMAADMGTFSAKTLFQTSGFRLITSELRKKVQFWSQNNEMCDVTEQVVFTEPYIVADNNRWTSPQLDNDKKEIENDVALKLAAAGWKLKFVTQTQALLHADLHSGSVMCSQADHQTFVIDPEFAFYGPAAFDTGAFIANLFLAYVSQEGQRHGENDYGEWILQQIRTFWTTFADEFVAMWNDPDQHTGFVYGRELFGDDQKACQEEYMKTMLADTLGFAGMKILRRIVGIAHVEDLEIIEDDDVRAKCERHGLTLAKAFIKTSSSFESIDDAIQWARDSHSQ